MDRAEKEFIEELMHKHYDTMHQFAYRKINDNMIAQELVQETFLVACVKIDDILDHDNPLGFLFQTLKNLIIREMQKAYRTREVKIEDEQWSTVGHEDELFSIEQHLPSGLTEEQRKLILLQVKYKLSNSEIAEQMGISEPAARKRLSRAKIECRKLMEKENLQNI